MNKRLEVGDYVSVNFNGAQITLCHSAEILYMPQQTGDAWIFRDDFSDDIHYVSEGCTVTLLAKHDD